MLYLFDDYALDTDRRELRRGGVLVPVEPRAFDLLTYVVENRRRVVSRDDLIAHVWDGRIVSESALGTCLNAARTAIGDSGEAQRLIKTLPRKGIRFIGVVREGEKPEAAAAATAAAAELPKPGLALPDRPSIAVLPFTNMSGDPEQEYFADGMAEEIITALSRCSWLFVIARNSSFTYKGKAVDVRQIGRELGVRYVLEGSVRRGGNRLRFTGQLIDAESGAHIWADRFDGEMSDVFELQDQFTQSVVAGIEPRLQRAEIERLKRKPAASLDAYDLLLRAQQLEYQFTAESLGVAIRCLEQALAVDPMYAPAMALAAYCYAERHIQGWAEDSAAEAAEGLRLATRALEFGKDDANVLWMAAYAVRRFALDVQRAKELAYRSMLLNPNSAMASATAGWLEVLAGNSDQGLELLRRAQRMSPLDPRGWFITGIISTAHFAQGRFEDAVLWARRALDQNPRFAQQQRFLAASLAHLGQREKAAAVVQQILKEEPHHTLAKLRARMLGIDEGIWSRLAAGLRLAGLPD